MILIVSYNIGTANVVIDWIVSLGVKYHIINPYLDKIDITEVVLTTDESEIELEFNKTLKTKLSCYTGVWIWHGHLSFDNCSTGEKKKKNKLLRQIDESLIKHHGVLKNYLGEFLLNSNCKVIGDYKIRGLNKLEILLKAKQLGIFIPDSIVVSKKYQVEKYAEKYNLITKPYHEISFLTQDKFRYSNYTSEVNGTDKMESTFFPTLIQEKIKKMFEIRTFFLIDKFYSMAIFSQESQETQTDFRNYNYSNPNRNVPFKLTEEIETKLRQLFKLLNLNSGSVDMIYSHDNKFVFLEINPIGQFGMVSYPCNYHLEKKIAMELVYGKH